MNKQKEKCDAGTGFVAAKKPLTEAEKGRYGTVTERLRFRMKARVSIVVQSILEEFEKKFEEGIVDQVFGMGFLEKIIPETLLIGIADDVVKSIKEEGLEADFQKGEKGTSPYFRVSIKVNV